MKKFEDFLTENVHFDDEIIDINGVQCKVSIYVSQRDIEISLKPVVESYHEGSRVKKFSTEEYDKIVEKMQPLNLGARPKGGLAFGYYSSIVVQGLKPEKVVSDWFKVMLEGLNI